MRRNLTVTAFGVILAACSLASASQRLFQIDLAQQTSYLLDYYRWAMDEVIARAVFDWWFTRVFGYPLPPLMLDIFALWCLAFGAVLRTVPYDVKPFVDYDIKLEYGSYWNYRLRLVLKSIASFSMAPILYLRLLSDVVFPFIGNRYGKRSIDTLWYGEKVFEENEYRALKAWWRFQLIWIFLSPYVLSIAFFVIDRDLKDSGSVLLRALGVI